MLKFPQRQAATQAAAISPYPASRFLSHVFEPGKSLCLSEVTMANQLAGLNTNKTQLILIV